MENFDPDNPDQQLIHNCMKHARRHLNPIIDWTTDEVWEFIREYEVPYCSLYDEGFERLGCIGCPMATYKHRVNEFERWPTYKMAYIRAFDKMIKVRNEGGVSQPDNQRNRPVCGMGEGQSPKSWTQGSTGEEVMKWWMEVGGNK